MSARLPLGLALALALAVAPAHALSNAAPASLLVFPLISVDADGVDTLVRLTHLGEGPQAVRCVYLDGSLAPGSGSEFLLTLTAGQPLAWHAGTGLAELPASGSSGRIPPVPVVPFSGTLRCLAADPAGVPMAADALIATATIERTTPVVDSATYAAIGLAATGASADAPDVLVLGGPMAEYDACPQTLSVQPLLDGAVVELGGSPLQRRTATRIALTTCGSTPVGGETATVDLELTTELGELFTARRAIGQHLVTDLSRLDTNLPANSIFNAANAGAPSGHLRIVPAAAGNGVLAVLLTAYADLSGPQMARRAAVPVQMSGTRELPDLVDLAVPPDAPTPTPTVPPSACTGDCNDSGDVSINELIVGVNIALGNAAVSSCAAFDADGGDTVTISELIAAVNNALGGCA
jgi:hypothetical protein